MCCAVIHSLQRESDYLLLPLQGFAYIEFGSEDALAQAVQKDGVTIKGQQLFIAKSAPPGGSFARGRGRGGRFPLGGGRGDFSGNRGRGGRGGGRLPHVPVSAAHGNMGHQRHHLQLDAEHTGARMPQLVPRAVASKAAADAPKSNDEFRKMLPQKKK